MIEGSAGFDWDDGNVDKCQKHGLALDDIEAVFSGDLAIRPDSLHSQDEVPFSGIGKTGSGRHVFVVFTFRHFEDRRYIRPISARYMHAKEIELYEESFS